MADIKNKNRIHIEEDTDKKLLTDAVPNKKNSISLRLICSVVCILLLFVILFIPRHNENIVLEPSDMGIEQNINMPEAIIDWVYYAGLYTPYAILQITCVTDEIISLWDYEDNRGDYNKIECNVIYDYSTGRYDRYGRDFSGIDEIYIITEIAQRLAVNDIIFISVEEQCVDSIYYFSPVTYNGQTEYISIVDNQIVLNGDEEKTISFHPLFELNQLMRETKDRIERGVGTCYDFDAFPKNEFQNGMSINDLIDYLSAWENVKKIRDMELENKSVPYQ